MQRTGRSPLRDLQLLANYVRLIRELRPDVILAYTQKPIIYGGLASRLTGIGAFYALMSGLGHAFSPGVHIPKWLRFAITRLYRAGVDKAQAIFVFNSADREDMIAFDIINADQKVIQVPGSGIDTERFAFSEIRSGPPHFLMIARLMRDKGVMEYLEAARHLAREFPDARFSILGHFETENPTGLGENECAKLAEEYPVQFLPPTSDVRPALHDCSAFVLPSYYREGLPRTILEAMSTGRPVVTTDTPGCRDAVTDGETGFIVPPRDTSALTDAMRKLASDPNLTRSMGGKARRRAEEVYDVRLVNGLLLREMQLAKTGGSKQPRDLAERNERPATYLQPRQGDGTSGQSRREEFSASGSGGRCSGQHGHHDRGDLRRQRVGTGHGRHASPGTQHATFRLH